METRSEHTPLPWSIDLQDELDLCIGCDEAIDNHGYTWAIQGTGDNNVLSGYVQNPAYANNEANAQFIIRACNSHDELLEVLEALFAEKSAELNDGEKECYAWTRFPDCDPSGNWLHALQIIAKAQGLDK